MWLVQQRSFISGVLLLLMLTVQSAFAGVAIEDYERRPDIKPPTGKRLDALLPTLMRETGVDMWLVIAREYNDDPVPCLLSQSPVSQRVAPLCWFSLTAGTKV